MKIIYHHRTQKGDAQGIHITEIINAFRKLNHEVLEISLVKDNSNIENKTKKNIFLEIITLLMPRFLYELIEIFYNFYGYFKLKNEIKIFKPDFIYERYSSFNFCGVLVAKHTGTKICLEVNAPLHMEKIKFERLIFKRLSKFIENWVCNNATTCIVISSPLKEILVKQGVRREKLNVIINGINPDHFKKVGKNTIRKKYKIPEKAVIIGVVAWFRKWHGLDLLIKTCYKNSLFQFKKVYLLLLGDGPAVPECKAYVKEKCIEKYVIFAGAIERERIAEHIDAFDIALQPRVTNYACPMKIIEYLAMGKAIIAPDQENIREILTDRKNALLFKPDDMDDLCSKIHTILKYPNYKRELSKNALKTIKEKKLTWIENADRAIDLINGYSIPK
jgi:glycosyltransferase involved in cell wall biosynthesis